MRIISSINLDWRGRGRGGGYCICGFQVKKILGLTRGDLCPERKKSSERVLGIPHSSSSSWPYTIILNFWKVNDYWEDSFIFTWQNLIFLNKNNEKGKNINIFLLKVSNSLIRRIYKIFVHLFVIVFLLSFCACHWPPPDCVRQPIYPVHSQIPNHPNSITVKIFPYEINSELLRNSMTKMNLKG